MKTMTILLLLGLTLGCGGTPAAGPTLTSDASPAAVAPDVHADAGEAATDARACGWACFGVGWFNDCTGALAEAAESCARCGVSCPLDGGDARSDAP